MTPEQFSESTHELTRPPSMTADQCGSLPVFIEEGRVLSSWRMTWRERLSALVFGRLWLWVHSGTTQPPVALSVERSPFPG